ncbi:MAG: aspartate/methionine/tyrosine aminotransferase [Planctomycetota bacterium]|jgi:aspartate/methionine/tyrosine aminotransferase
MPLRRRALRECPNYELQEGANTRLNRPTPTLNSHFPMASRPPAAEALQFPYMHWILEHSFQAPYCLAQSGMPAPDPALIGDLAGAEALAYPGVDALPRIERKIADHFGVAPERVLVTVGASGAMALCAARWFRPGTRVVADLPSYEPFRALPERAGAQLALVKRRLEDGWQLDPFAVAQRLAGCSGPGHVFTSNPHNPTGAVSPRETVLSLAAAAEHTGGVLISCEAYMDFLPHPQRLHAHDLAPNALSIGSLTKAYGLGPLRIGWIVLGEGLLDQRAHLRDMANLTWIEPPTPCLVLAARAFDHLEDLLMPLRQLERGPRRSWEHFLRETPELTCFSPEHGIIAFPRVNGVSDTLGLARELARTQGVSVGAGEYFGLPGYIRVGCGLPAETLDEALARLATGIRGFISDGDDI